MRRFHRIVGMGSVTQLKPRVTALGHVCKPAWHWQVTARNDFLAFAETFGPWLGARRSAKLAEVLAGMGSPRAVFKLTDEDVAAIRAVPAYVGAGAAIARAYGVSSSHVLRIRSGERREKR